MERLQTDDTTRAQLAAGQPAHIEVYERALQGEFAGWLRKGLSASIVLIIVEITMLGGERKVIERQWHRGDMPLEHVLNINTRPAHVYPP